MCMGSADVVPGVSGGSIALLLGIYERFISALRNLDFRWLKPLGACFRTRFSKDSRVQLVRCLEEMDLFWLLTLLAGLVCAFGVASIFIPKAMERAPELMLSFFFGLVLASISAPYRMITRFGLKEFVLILVFGVFFYWLLGSQWQVPLHHTQYFVTQPQTLEQILSTQSSLHTPYELCQLPPNRALCLIETHPTLNPANAGQILLPQGSVLEIGRPQWLYIFVSGFLAICAMILPGISGSFLLLVLGMYYFMLSSIKRFFYGLSQGDFLATDFGSVVVFVSGVLAGIVLFSRLLHWLLKHFLNPTLAAIIGIMLGSLRSIWPFKATAPNIEHGTINILPDPSSALSYYAALAMLAGIALVVGIQWYAQTQKKSAQAEQTLEHGQ